MRLQADSTCAHTRAASVLVKEQLDAGRAVRLTVPTASMWPTLSPGDAVLVRGAQPGEPRVGDIVVGKWGEGWRAHRLVDRRCEAGQTLFVTQGDNSGVADEAWPASQLVGVVVAVRRGEREVNLQSARARWAGAGLAFLLYSRRVAQRAPGQLARRAVLKGLRWVVRASAWLARRVS
jgi:signal peptidase I